MTTFKNHLEIKGKSRSSIENYWQEALQFIDWAEAEKVEAEQAGYNDILHYIHHLQKRGVVQATIYRYLNSLKHYLNWLVQTGARADNPIQHLSIKGVKKKTLYHILGKQDLENLYSGYQQETPAGKRNKMMLGLLLYQGLDVTNLQNLETKDLKLREGKIYIRGNRRSNERLLQLEPHQVLDLMEYTLQTRPGLLKMTGKESDQLFISAGTGQRVHNALQKLLKQLKRIGPKVESLRQIRASVITHWLKIYNLRQVQYMAGHRYVSSTEAYLVNDVEDLMNDIEKYHPSGR